jgi:hypothetical protein
MSSFSLSSGGEPAIQRQRDTGNECCARRAEIKHGSGDFFRPTESTDWMSFKQIVPSLIVTSDSLGHVRFDDRRTNCIDSHTFGRELERHRFRETDDRELAGSVDWRAGVWSESKYRSIVYDCAGTGLKDRGDLMFHAEKDTSHVRVHDVVEDFAGVGNTAPASPPTPALLKAKSSRPKCSTVRATSAAISSSRVTSVRTYKQAVAAGFLHECH